MRVGSLLHRSLLAGSLMDMTMRTRLGVMLGAAVVFAGVATVPWVRRSSVQAQTARTPVLVELFTSEGCSTCPPADALLMRLEQQQPIAGAEVIALGEHVDYWDELGWHDRFSSHQFTDRQNEYGRRFKLESVYTPQMVVDGTDELVGNDEAKARRAIQKGAQGMMVGLRISGIAVDGQKVTGTVSVAGTPPKGDLYVALVDPADETRVRAGENGGKTLHHAAVVRSLVRVGALQNLAGGGAKFSLTVPADAKPSVERVVVFAQQAGQGAVVGAAMASVGESRTVAAR
jgi:hypothetical protein